MAIIKCKMCGGELNIVEDSSVCECEYCGTKQTVPKVDDEKKLKLFTRAGKLLRGCEFDKASGVFESIISDFPEEAEAYWGLILCKYGIEYVDDPATGNKVPTCHRSSFESVEDDANFEQACENADAVARRVYREEARQIETLRKRILEVSGKEEPYDIFISYKELDEDGDRTPDSVIAQDIYRTLTKEGYRVFFSRISLEGKLGVEYEPYIFAALNSAKVMIVVGTDYEYFDAVWVKNEWSRFLKLIASGQKKAIIPVYKDMDPYDMPKELRSLAAQDMGKIGAMQDLLHGVEKLLVVKKVEAVREIPTVTVQSGGPNVQALLKRGDMALEDGEWDKAKDFYDQVLNMDAENGNAFLGLALAASHCVDINAYIQTLSMITAQVDTLKISRDKAHIDATIKEFSGVGNYLSSSSLSNLYSFDESYRTSVRSVKEMVNKTKAAFQADRNLNRALRFAEPELKRSLESMKEALFSILDEKLKQAEASALLARQVAERNYARRIKEADEMAKTKYENALKTAESDYQKASMLMEKADSANAYDQAGNAFAKIGAFRDAPALAEKCAETARKTREEEREQDRIRREQDRIRREQKERAEEEARLQQKRESYEARIAELEKEMKHPSSVKSVVQRASLARDLKWYRDELKKLR